MDSSSKVLKQVLWDLGKEHLLETFKLNMITDENAKFISEAQLNALGLTEIGLQLNFKSFFRKHEEGTYGLPGQSQCTNAVSQYNSPSIGQSHENAFRRLSQAECATNNLSQVEKECRDAFKPYSKPTNFKNKRHKIDESYFDSPSSVAKLESSRGKRSMPRHLEDDRIVGFLKWNSQTTAARNVIVETSMQLGAHESATVVMERIISFLSRRPKFAFVSHHDIQLVRVKGREVHEVDVEKIDGATICRFYPKEKSAVYFRAREWELVKGENPKRAPQSDSDSDFEITARPLTTKTYQKKTVDLSSSDTDSNARTQDVPQYSALSPSKPSVKESDIADDGKKSETLPDFVNFMDSIGGIVSNGTGSRELNLPVFVPVMDTTSVGDKASNRSLIIDVLNTLKSSMLPGVVQIYSTRSNAFSKFCEKSQLDSKLVTKHLSVTLAGESGIDAGALTREFCRLALIQAFQELCEPAPFGYIFSSSAMALEEEKFVHFAKLIVVALLNGHPGPKSFAPAVANWLLQCRKADAEPSICDIPGEELRSTLTNVRDAGSKEEFLALLSHTDLLSKLGCRRLPSFNEKDSFIKAACKFFVIHSVKAPMDQFLQGLGELNFLDSARQLPDHFWPLFVAKSVDDIVAKELVELFQIEFAEIGNTKRPKEEAVIEHLFNTWQEIEECPLQCQIYLPGLTAAEDTQTSETVALSLGCFLTFATGSQGLSAVGYGSFTPTIQFYHPEPEEDNAKFYITANVCANTVIIPVTKNYQSYDEFKAMFITSIASSPEFGRI